MLVMAPVGPVVPAMGLLPHMRMLVAVMPVVPRPRTPTPPTVEPATATPAPVTPTPTGLVMRVMAPVGPAMLVMGLLLRMRMWMRLHRMRMLVAVMPVVLRPRTRTLPVVGPVTAMPAGAVVTRAVVPRPRTPMPPAVEPVMATPAPVTAMPAGPVMLARVGPVVLVMGLLLRMRMRGRLPRIRVPRRRRSMRMLVAVMSVVLRPRTPMPPLVGLVMSVVLGLRMPPLAGLVMVVVRGLVRLLRVMRMVRRRPVRMPVAIMAVVLRLRMPMPAVGLMVGVRRRLMRLVLLWLVRLGWVLRGLVLLMLLVVERMPTGGAARPRIRIPVGLMVRGPGPTRARMALVAVTRLDGPATTAAPRAVSRRTPVPRARGPMSPGPRMRLRRTTRLILMLPVTPLLPLTPTGTGLTTTRCTTAITATVETMTIPILTSRAPVTAVRPTVTRPFPSCSKTAPATWRHVMRH